MGFFDIILRNRKCKVCGRKLPDYYNDEDDKDEYYNTCTHCLMEKRKEEERKRMATYTEEDLKRIEENNRLRLLGEDLYLDVRFRDAAAKEFYDKKNK